MNFEHREALAEGVFERIGLLMMSPDGLPSTRDRPVGRKPAGVARRAVVHHERNPVFVFLFCPVCGPSVRNMTFAICRVQCVQIFDDLL